ncbi:tetratricopeptide repeat protein [Candidatus Sumerlaeota bacterium]
MNDDVNHLFNEGVTHSLEAHEHEERDSGEQAADSDRKAVAAFDQVLDLDSQHLGALSGKGLALARLGKTQEAAGVFRKAIEIDPDYAENHRQLGLCFVELGDIALARQATFRALELETRAEFRRAAAVEIYNIAGGIMMSAAQHRDAGRFDDESQCYIQAKTVFSLTLDVDGSLQPAAKALRIVDSCMGVDAKEGLPERGQEDKKHSGPRGFWGRLFGRK